jgi:hypothetical protein
MPRPLLEVGCSLLALSEASGGRLEVFWEAPTLLLLATIPAVLALAAFGMSYGRMSSGAKGGILWAFLLTIGPFLVASVLGISGQMDSGGIQYVIAISPLTALGGAPFAAISNLSASGQEMKLEVVGVSIAVNAALALVAYRRSRELWTKV